MNLENIKLSGAKTYIALVVAIIYWTASRKGLIPADPLLDATSLGLVVAFLRSGMKKDSAKVVKAIKAEAPVDTVG